MADEKKVTLTIDGQKTAVPEGTTIMQAADSLGIRIPRLCWHPKLSPATACRLCIVEVEGAKNFPTACSTQVREGMVVRTTTPEILRARRDIVELLLDNHPRDCQICERNNACDLQELAATLGVREFLFEGERKRYPKDASSPSIVRDPEKCVLCGRCNRVCTEIQGVNALSFCHRGFKTIVAPAFNRAMAESVCVACGQCTLFCPTAALTEKDETAEVWKALSDPEKVVVVQIAPAVRVAIGEAFGMEPGADMTGQTVTALRMLGCDVVFDTQFSADLTIVEEASELVHRLKTGGTLPMFTSCCPGWIKFCEQFHPEILGNLSTCKSPQQMMGALIKTYYARKAGVDPGRIFSVSIMPCTAKKFEKNRPEMASSGYRDVDAVLTTRELAKMIRQAGIRLAALPPGVCDDPLGESTGAAPIFGVTGGVMEAALRTAYEYLTGSPLGEITFSAVRGFEGIREATVQIAGTEVRVAAAYGLANAHRLIEEISGGKRSYHFVEIMACPGGCLGGGGQPYPPAGIDPLDREFYSRRAAGLYRIDEAKARRKSHENPQIVRLYEEFLVSPLGEKSHALLHTHYCPRQPKGIPSRTRETISI